MTELKRCPFCGGEARNVTNMYFWSVRCRACGVESGDYATPSEAIEAWNTRHEETCRMEPLNAFYTDLNGLNQTEWGVCSNCGTASPIDATYCCECGRKVER